MPAAIATAPAAKDPCGRYNAYTATPTSVQTARYDPRNSGTVRTRPLARARLKTAGAAPGSIIAAIIDTHRATKNANEPSPVATPMSIPFICRTATTQDAAASPSVAVSAAAVAAVLALVMAAERGVGVVSVRYRIEQLVAAAAPMSQPEKPATRSLGQPAEAPSAPPSVAWGMRTGARDRWAPGPAPVFMAASAARRGATRPGRIPR